MINELPRGLDARYDMTIHDAPGGEIMTYDKRLLGHDDCQGGDCVRQVIVNPNYEGEYQSPKAETALLSEIEEIVGQGWPSGAHNHTARRILQIPRIARALAALRHDDMVYNRHPESSDAR